MSPSRAGRVPHRRAPPRAAVPCRRLAAIVAALVVACGGGGGASGGGGGGPPPPTSPAAPWEGTPATAIVAEAGPDRSVDAGARVTLDGTRSRSPAGAITSWSWVQTAGPAVQLASAGTARPSLDAPEVDGAGARLSFALTVRDGTAATALDTVHVDVHERAAQAPTTSVGKIRRAMEEGTLDRETALEYLAFASWGDPRLPAEFVGEPSKSGSWARAVLSEEYATLSSEAQAIVLPFLLPPGHPEGYASSISAGRIAPGAAALPPAARRSVEGAHVVVWYRTTLAGGATTASDLVAEIEGTIWKRLVEVWTAEHLPVLDDAKVGAAFDGVHGKLNVFLEPIADYGYMQPYGAAAPVPTYVVLRESLAFSAKSPAGLIESAAHEMTHACQYSFKHAETYSGHRFLFEATATWAEDDVYPKHHSEQEYAPGFLRDMTLPLDDDTGDRPYGAYLFFQWVTRGAGDPAFVRRSFEHAQTAPQLAAVDEAFPRWGGLELGFEELWGDFVDQIWNRNPEESFWGVDDLAVGAQAVRPPVSVSVGATGDASYAMDAGVQHLAARFHRFTLDDPDVRTIHFFDGFTTKLAYLTTDDGSVFLALDPTGVLEDTTGKVTRMFLKRGDRWTALARESPSIGDRSICQDTPAESVEEIAIAYGDAIPERGHSRRPLGEPPLLWVTNIGCDHWEGTVSAQTSVGRTDLPQETITATNVLFTRWHPYGLDTGELAFQLEGADVTWSIGGQVANCSYAGSASWHQGSPNGPTGSLAFVPTIFSGGSHRRYEAGAIGSEHPVSYTITCTFPDGSDVVTATKVVEWLRTESVADPTWRPTVSDDGQVAAGTADAGDLTYTWSFQAGPGLEPLGR